MGSTDLHGVAETNCTNEQTIQFTGAGSTDLHGVAETNCTNKQTIQFTGTGSTDLHGVAETNCTNKQSTGFGLQIYTGWQKQTVQISKRYIDRIPMITNQG